MYELKKPQLIVADAEIVRHITVKDAHVFINRRDIDLLLDEVSEKLLFMMRGDDWKRVRNIMTVSHKAFDCVSLVYSFQPTFTSGKMRRMLSCMDSVADEAVEALRGKTVADVVDLKDFCGRYALDVIAACCFAVQPKSHENVTNPFWVAVKNAIKPQLW